MGQKEYYLDNDEATKNIREKFKLHIVKMFRLAGFSQVVAQKKMQSVMNIETRIAKHSKSSTELRDPESNYHKMSVKELKDTFAGINWTVYFDILGLNNLQNISVGQKTRFMKSLLS